MKAITATKGELIFVDDFAYDTLNQFTWRIWERGRYKYAINGQGQKMHRMIMYVLEKPKILVDHIDGNGLNNQKHNLRLCNNADNAKNRKMSSKNTTGYKGLYCNKTTGKYMSFCTGNGIRECSDYFIEDYKAALAYNDIAIRLHGKFARLNVLNDIDMLKMIMTGQMDELDRHLKMCQSDKTANDILQKYQK